MRPRKGSDPIVHTTNVVIRGLARRIQYLNTEMRDIDEEFERLIQETTPSLPALYGVGVDTAATLLVTVGDHPDRLHTERSWAHLCGATPIPAGSDKTSGKVRLNRGGDRSANAALYRIVLTRMASDDQTRTYVRRRRAEGRSTAEIMRCLKRYVARQTIVRSSMRKSATWYTFGMLSLRSMHRPYTEVSEHFDGHGIFGECFPDVYLGESPPQVVRSGRLVAV